MVAIETAIVGQEWKEKLLQFQKKYLPNVIYIGGAHESDLSLMKNKSVAGKTLIYVCKNKSCALPVELVDDAMKQVKKESEFSQSAP